MTVIRVKVLVDVDFNGDLKVFTIACLLFGAIIEVPQARNRGIIAISRKTLNAKSKLKL